MHRAIIRVMALCVLIETAMRHSYKPGQVGWSFEVFPPKTAEAEQALYKTCRELNRYRPVFISLTYGAGGTTREKSLEIAQKLIREVGTAVTAHFTCVGSTIEQIRAWMKQAEAIGVTNIMALRGDPPQGQTAFVASAGGLRYASELVKLIRQEFARFGIGVAGYPETHQEALSPEADLENLKRKVDNGSDIIYTQLFYDNEDFFLFQERVRRLGIKVPVVPGLLPVLSLKQVQRITSLCKAKLPDTLVNQLELHANDPEAQMEVGIEHCTMQVAGLLRAGVPGIHFYVLNRSDSVQRILGNVGVEPR
jgi:methylenetetrahydrofolate reductase (NADPH)